LISDINSARCGHVLLWFSQEICHLITMNVETRITCFNHLFFVEQSHGLSFTFELQCVDKLISQNGMWTKLNNHRMTFGSKLHGVNSFDSYRIHENGTESTDGGHFDQLAQGLLNIKKGRINLPICIG
jgi:hypothetical protein